MNTRFSAKIIDFDDTESNEKNQSWWQDNPMSYDWSHDLGEIKYNKNYFGAIDHIFSYGHSLCNNPRWPEGYILENFIPYNDLQGKSVLEIGCGAGLITSHITKAGAHLTAIDLTDQAIEITKARFDLENLSADIKQMNAEKMEFENDTFDLVISWGVIHHSGNMQNIIDEIYRVLKPGGKVYLMIYNKNSIRSIIYAYFWLGVVRAKLITLNVKEIISKITDGYIARHLSEVEFNKMATMFKSIEYSYSDEIDTISSYTFGPFRRIFLPFPKVKKNIEKFLATRWGWYMQIILQKEN